MSCYLITRPAVRKINWSRARIHWNIWQRSDRKQRWWCRLLCKPDYHGYYDWCHKLAEGYYSVQDVIAPTIVITLKSYRGHMKYYRVKHERKERTLIAELNW